MMTQSQLEVLPLYVDIKFLCQLILILKDLGPLHMFVEEDFQA